MKLNLLPIDHDAVLIDKVPSRLVAAVRVGASDWLRKFELLLDVLHQVTAL